MERSLPASIRRCLSTGLLFALLGVIAAAADTGSGTIDPSVERLAESAAERYESETIEALARLVEFRTFKLEKPADPSLPEFVAIRRYLEQKASELGFDYQDHGLVVVVGLGDSDERLGLVTHGDVQPADASQWAQDPFSLDLESEPGRLIGRGAEDDKGAIAVALYAMKAIADAKVPLNRRIELIISLSEEVDWDPLRDFLVANPPPPINIVFDSEFPVTVAEKAWGGVDVFFPLWRDGQGAEGPWIAHLEAGTGLSIVPSRAEARVEGATPELLDVLKEAARRTGVPEVLIEDKGSTLHLRASGVGAHSSVPEEGVNALTRLAQVLGVVDWPPSAAAGVVRLVNDLVGPGNYAERFGDLAYRDDFMGPLTLTAARVRTSGWDLELGISYRRPSGRTREAVFASTLQALANWQAQQPPGGGFGEVHVSVGDPMDQRDAPHVDTLLRTYRHFTGDSKAQPIAIGGSTHAKLLRGAVNFGPAMPGVAYTGHSEHEFVTRDQIVLNLKMMTAALLELTADMNEKTPEEKP